MTNPARRPGLSRWHPATLIGTWFGAGRLPISPGSWASLAALPAAWGVKTAFGTAGLAAAAAILFAGGCWAGGKLAAASGAHDPGLVVIDEVAGQFLALLPAARDPASYAIGFLLFRLFDIWKPWPVNWADRRVGGGFGIMLDDVLAAVYALLLLAAIEGARGVRP